MQMLIGRSRKDKQRPRSGPCRRRAVPALVAALLFGACAQAAPPVPPLDETRERAAMEEAIERHMRAHLYCISLPMGNRTASRSDAVVALRAFRNSEGTYVWEDEVRRVYDAFVAAGLLTAEGEAAPTGPRTWRTYRLTPLGETHFRQPDGRARRGRFCYGFVVRLSVLDYSPIRQSGCDTLSSANILYRFASIPEWTKTAEFRAAFPDALTPKDEDVVRHLYLPLSRAGDGWAIGWPDRIHNVCTVLD